MKRIKDVNWILLICFICLTFLMTVQSVNSPISSNYAYSDYSVYQYVAQVMRGGGMPYRDTFDNKGPVFYLVNELGSILHPRYGMWAIDFLLMFGTVVYAYKTANKVLNKKWSFLTVAVVLSGISAWGYWIGDTPESCILFFLMAVMHFFAEYIDCQSLTDKQILTVGFCAAVALLVKPTCLVMFLVFAVEILYGTVKRRDFQFLKRCLVFFSIPFFGITALIVAWLAVNGAFWECVNQYIVFNINHIFAAGNSVKAVFYSFLGRPATLLGLFCVWISFMRWKEYTEKEKHLLASVYVVWMLVFCISIMPGRAYQQYTVIYYPMILVSVAFALKDIGKLWRENVNKRVMGTVLIALVGGNVLLSNAKETAVNIRNFTAEHQEKGEVVAYLKSIPGEYRVSVVSPDDNWIYLQTGRFSATKYSYTPADLIYGNDKTDFIREYASEINEKQPRFIVEQSRNRLYSDQISGNIQLEYREVFRNEQYIVYEYEKSDLSFGRKKDCKKEGHVMNYNERIRELRKDKSLVQQEIADMLEVGQRTYADYENGKTRIPVKSLLILARFYDVSMDYISGASNVKERYPSQ